ncbi:hypothetical protein BKA62DRAFT_755940 [Auriculariales sp. MPI-PUGE-AT-0066]|nr:hypothetical protein BKA62DRAFT_755940 [Auriculariales sp. MPI-PUGE-AT-0066]
MALTQSKTVKSVKAHLALKRNVGRDRQLIRSEAIEEASAAGRVVVQDEYTAAKPLDLRGVALNDLYIVHRSDGSVPGCPIVNCAKKFKTSLELARHIFSVGHGDCVVMPLHWVCILESKALGSYESALHHFTKRPTCATAMVEWLSEREDKCTLQEYVNYRYVGPLPAITSEQVTEKSRQVHREEFIRCLKYTNWNGIKAEKARISKGLPLTDRSIPSAHPTASLSRQQSPSYEASEMSAPIQPDSPHNESTNDEQELRQLALALDPTPAVPFSSSASLAPSILKIPEDNWHKSDGEFFGLNTELFTTVSSPSRGHVVSPDKEVESTHTVVATRQKEVSTPAPEISAPPTPEVSAPPTPWLSAPPTPEVSAPPTPWLSAPPTPGVSAPPTPSAYPECSPVLSNALPLASTPSPSDEPYAYSCDQKLWDAATGEIDWLADVAAIEAGVARRRPTNLDGSIHAGPSIGITSPLVGQMPNLGYNDRSSHSQASQNIGAQSSPPVPVQPIVVPPFGSFYQNGYQASSGRVTASTSARRDYRVGPYHQAAGARADGIANGSVTRPRRGPHPLATVQTWSDSGLNIPSGQYAAPVTVPPGYAVNTPAYQLAHSGNYTAPVIAPHGYTTAASTYPLAPLPVSQANLPPFVYGNPGAARQAAMPAFVHSSSGGQNQPIASAFANNRFAAQYQASTSTFAYNESARQTQAPMPTSTYNSSVPQNQARMPTLAYNGSTVQTHLPAERCPPHFGHY